MTRTEAQNIALLAQCQTATMAYNRIMDKESGIKYCYCTELKYLIHAVPILSCYEPYNLTSYAQYAITSDDYRNIKIESADDADLNFTVTVVAPWSDTLEAVTALCLEIISATDYSATTEAGGLLNAFCLTAPDTIEGCVEYTVSIKPHGGAFAELFTGTIGCANNLCDFDVDQLGMNIKSLTQICCS